MVPFGRRATMEAVPSDLTMMAFSPLVSKTALPVPWGTCLSSSQRTSVSSPAQHTSKLSAPCQARSQAGAEGAGNTQHQGHFNGISGLGTP